ncbi:MAG: PDZ domain-containing protein [Deltaproteobacteria bacterium]
MRSSSPSRPWRRALLHLSLGLQLLLPLTGHGAFSGSRPEVEIGAIEKVMQAWIAAVRERDGAAGELLLSRSAREYWPAVREQALHATADELQLLGPLRQLQVMLLRGLTDADALRAMSSAELLGLALEAGFLGQDLRRSDLLREVRVSEDRAEGRLYKLGRSDRPDRALQYFRKEQGSWRIDLRGEHERLRRGFDAFVVRSGLSADEAAFFLLEARLMRKVVPTEFASPLLVAGMAADHATDPAAAAAEDPRTQELVPRIRLVALRHEENDLSASAATLEDRWESMRYVLEAGEALPTHPGFVVVEIGARDVVLQGPSGLTRLPLDLDGPALGARLRSPRGAHAASLGLLHHARLGEQQEGMMALWRNIGLRERPQLLQQATLVPEFGPGRAGERSLKGLRVRRIAEASFWDQLGLKDGDLLTWMDGEPIDSLAAWQRVIDRAEVERRIAILVERDGRALEFRIETIAPHGERG